MRGTLTMLLLALAVLPALGDSRRGHERGPLVIGHRCASGYLHEHTSSAPTTSSRTS